MQWLPQIPMLPLSDELQAAMMSSIDVRAELSPEDLPSAVLYTFVNTHKSLHCVTTSEDGTLVAGGVFTKGQPAALPAAVPDSLLPLLKMQQHSAAALGRRRKLHGAATQSALLCIACALAPVPAVQAALQTPLCVSLMWPVRTAMQQTVQPLAWHWKGVPPCSGATQRL